MTGIFANYRAVADKVEGGYFELSAGTPLAVRLKYLRDAYRRGGTDRRYREVSLKLLCHEISGRLLTSARTPSLRKLRQAARLFKRAVAYAEADPDIAISAANHFFYAEENPLLAKTFALRGIFLAEAVVAHVRHAHQTLVRIGATLEDWSSVEASVERLSRYRPSFDSPDPALEADVRDIVVAAPIGEAAKVAFLAAFERQGPA